MIFFLTNDIDRKALNKNYDFLGIMRNMELFKRSRYFIEVILIVEFAITCGNIFIDAGILLWMSFEFREKKMLFQKL